MYYISQNNRPFTHSKCLIFHYVTIIKTKPCFCLQKLCCHRHFMYCENIIDVQFTLFFNRITRCMLYLATFTSHHA